MRKKIPNYKIVQMIQRDEDILWLGKPNKLCMILESVFNPLLPFALIWALFDGGFISAFLINTRNYSILPFYIIFFSIHLMPVWIYLGGVILTGRKYKNTEFAITNKAVYISGGILSANTERRNYTQFSNIEIKRGFFDNKLKVGDVNLTSKNEQSVNGHGLRVFSIFDIPDFNNVYDILMNNFKQTRLNYEMYMQNNPVKQSDNIPYYQQELPDYPGNIQSTPDNSIRQEQYKNDIPEHQDNDERRVDW